MTKKAQVSTEYLIVVGFITLVLIGILAIAIIYSGAVKDKIKMSQITTFASKIISSSEKTFYSGEPSKATFYAYLPDNVLDITIDEDSLFFTIQTSSGINKISFSSNVPISGTLTSSSGLKKIQVIAQGNTVIISQV